MFKREHKQCGSWLLVLEPAFLVGCSSQAFFLIFFVSCKCSYICVLVDLIHVSIYYPQMRWKTLGRKPEEVERDSWNMGADTMDRVLRGIFEGAVMLSVVWGVVGIAKDVAVGAVVWAVASPPLVYYPFFYYSSAMCKVSLSISHSISMLL